MQLSGHVTMFTKLNKTPAGGDEITYSYEMTIISIRLFYYFRLNNAEILNDALCFHK